MTEVGHAEITRLLQSKRNECSAILTSRKRKLRELFAVATQIEPLPQDALDKPSVTAAEWQFLQANDIQQGRILNEQLIPTRPALSVQGLKRSLAAATGAAGPSSASAPPAKKPHLQPTPAHLATGPSSVSSSASTPGSGSTTPITRRPGPATPTLLPQTNTQTAAAAASPKPLSPQVSLPPGSSKPSPTDTTRPPLHVKNANARPGEESLTVKLPQDGARQTDAASSPGSTAPSATTPAVHEVSANTSPDHEGSQFVVDTSDKPALKAAQDAADVKETEASASAEDQLLQESIRSENESKVVAGSGANKSSPSVSTANKVEVADSQDEMDVDSVAPTTTNNTTTTTTNNTTSSSDRNTSSKPPIPTSHTTTLSTSKDSAAVPERAVTRVSSGAMRLKSVNEIVGDQLTPSASTPQSPASKANPKDKSRSNQMPTVLFGKQPKRVDDKSVVPGGQSKDSYHPFDDYYTPLFIQNFTGATNWMQPIEKVLFHANKTLATTDANLAIQDHQACKVLRRVYHLQQHDKWSLRQPKRCPEPTRPTSQWDVLIQEMKWMRTDFREERKWKMTVARNLAYSCAEWHASTPEERKLMQVAAVIPPIGKAEASQEDVKMAGTEDETADDHPTPDLMSSGDGESLPNEDEIAETFVETVAPSAIFSLHDDDVVFGLRKTQASEELLEELPLFGAPLKIPHSDPTDLEFDPDAHWRRPALPISKYVEGEMKITSRGPPRRRGRFDHQNEESDDEGDSTFAADHVSMRAVLPASDNDVALFNPESKAIRDRLHAGHQFRPPSEYPMPTQGFYEWRSSSQWTVTEDDELRSLVREYSYNWSLISNMLCTKSLFQSGPERRTPWECFERWINLEGLPADMQRTQYFKTYNGRIEAAQRVIAHQNQVAAQQAQQASTAGNVVTPLRRRPSTPVRVERRKNQKHLTLIDAMRRLAKKREANAQKAQHNAQQNAAKKVNEAIPQRPTKTPRDYSLLRWERDQALAEKMAQYAQRQEAQRRAALQARAAQNGQLAAAAAAAGGNSNGLPQANAAMQAGNAAAVAAAAAAAGRPVANQLAAAAAVAAAAGQVRPRVPMQNGANGAIVAGAAGQVNGAMLPPGQQIKGIPQAQLQAAMASQQQRLAAMAAQSAANGQTDPNLMLRAQRMAEQQRAAVMQQHAQAMAQQQQQQQQQGGASSPGQQPQSSPPLRNGVVANGVAQQNFAGNANMMAANFASMQAQQQAQQQAAQQQQANGAHMANGASPAPRMATQVPPGILLQLNQLDAQIRAKHPNMTPEQSRALAAEQLTRVMQQQRAMNSAAGSTGIANSIAATSSPQQYAALLRQQQQQQAAAQQQAQQNQQMQRVASAQAQQQAAAQAAAAARQASSTPASDK
ncbi:hypothetical protein VHEMI08803 [[Torrubiella] hemipterigena]|uniref:Vacuolar import and degradation protein 21 n=1 Tax=[Torrubiella] hemipterigena TaxID=1531966 RepID=A0A0A1TEP9_9HYPO|nr:hypothetical protein VHEMI08803 [[Torrubiella] hemipterigena]